MYKGERFNSISHLLGAAFALIGASVLITLAAIEGNATRIISVSVYGGTLFLLFLCSTLYHSFMGRAKKVFRVLDYQSIYVLIAGTYTPFALIALEGTIRWWLFGFVWGLAAVGVLLEILPTKGPRVIPVIIYLIMGWCCVFVFDQIVTAVSSTGLGWLVAGGIVYTLGVIFYVLDHWLPWCHEIWHIFVLGGSVSHFIAIAQL
jgi:hemolysin III